MRADTPNAADYTFVVRMTDKPGAMELVAATFAHRGLSITATLGNDGTLEPEGHAVVLVRFRGTPARKEALKATLSRLARVVSVVEHPEEDTSVRQAALLRLVPDAPPPSFPNNSVATVETIFTHPETGETTYALLGPPALVGAVLEAARAAGHIRAITQTFLAL